jgi:hypothetical protein
MDRLSPGRDGLLEMRVASDPTRYILGIVDDVDGF